MSFRDAGTREQYQQVYCYIEEHAPHLLELMKDKKHRQEFNALISEVRGAHMQFRWLKYFLRWERQCGKCDLMMQVNWKRLLAHTRCHSQMRRPLLLHLGPTTVVAGWVLTTQNLPVYCAQSSTSRHFWLTQYSKYRTLSYCTANILCGDCSLGREKVFKKGALLPPQQAGQHSFTMATFQVKTLNLVASIKVSWGVFFKSAWVPVTCMLPHHSFSSTRFWSRFSSLLHLPYRKGRSSRLVLAMASSMGCGKSQLSISLMQRFTYVLLSHNTYCSVLLVLFQARFGLSSCEKWKQHDGIFDYADFYYRIMNFLMFKADNKWHKALYSYLNK